MEPFQQVLSILPAAGQFNYTKSAYLCLQSVMIPESTSNKNFHDSFKTRKFVVRRTSDYWVGLPSDLVIEQVLMRSLKSTGGGLTRGAGMSNVRYVIWS